MMKKLSKLLATTALALGAAQASAAPVVFNATLIDVTLSAIGGASAGLFGDLEHTLTLDLTAPTDPSGGGDILGGTLVQDAWGMDLISTFGLTATTSGTTHQLTPTGAPLDWVMGFAPSYFGQATAAGPKMTWLNGANAIGSGTVNSDDGSNITAGGTISCDDVSGFGFCGSIPAPSGYDLVELVLVPTGDQSGFQTSFMQITEVGASNTTIYTYQLTQVQEVPVPAAAWLFGSAMVGLVGIGRKRKIA